ncbi:MAG: RNA polymerase sigma factor [Deltaproteobacteria bacterium]|nr:RNA polymerase sigma factor [Deltaproteobacteria bacterium]
MKSNRGGPLHPGEEPHPPAHDLELVARAKEQDPDAIEQLIRRYQQKAYAVAYRICSGDAEEAADLTQEAFLRALRNLHTFKGNASFYTWLYQIVLNTCLDAVRRKQRRTRVFSLWRSWKQRGEGNRRNRQPLPESDPQNDPLTALSRKEFRRRVEQALEGLSSTQRMVFELKVFEERSIPEIACLTHSAVGTVKSHLFRATQHIRTALDEWSKE